MNETLISPRQIEVKRPLTELVPWAVLLYTMKKKKPKLPANSLEGRNMVRHAMPPPTTKHTDKKKRLNKKQGREDITPSS